MADICMQWVLIIFFSNPKTYDCEDVFISMRSGKAKSDNSTDLRGSYSFRNASGGGIINSYSPNTYRSFSKAVEGFKKPVISHEIGQYQVFPDFKEVALYKGVLKPWNFEIIKKRLQKKDLFGQSEDFLNASGKLSVLCYREEIEMALRTRGLDGFQLLDLQDFPGQGTSLVGILNAFMESKGLISEKDWRKFCNDIVPLARFSHYCYSDNDSILIDVDVAHYGEKSLHNQKINCSLTDDKGNVIYKKTFITDIQQGDVSNVGIVKLQLSNYSLSNQKLQFTIKLDDTEYENSWNLWCYSQTMEIKEGFWGDICVTRNIDEYNKCLKENKKVLYIPKRNDVIKKSVGGLFITEFWNYNMNKKALKEGKASSPGTFGLLINSEHPIFKYFPTEFHSNWQWWNIVNESYPIVLDKNKYVPIVQVIDNWDRNNYLGLIYEEPGSNGNAIVVASDLFSCNENIEVKALFKSIIAYLNEK